MIDINKLRKPIRMVNSIHKEIKRDYVLYSLYPKPGGLRGNSPSNLARRFDRLTKHLWYKDCGMTSTELRGLIEQEYHNFRLLEILDVS